MSISASAPWLNFYGDIPANLEYPALSMYQMVARTAQKFPSNIAYDFMGKKISYPQLVKRLDWTAKALVELGIQKGDRVTICMPNCPQAVDCFYALNRLGAVSTMIHPLSAPSEILFYIQNSKSKAILTLDQFYPKLSEIQSDLPNNFTILIAKIKNEFPPALALGFQLTKQRKLPKLPKTGYTLWTDFLAKGKTSNKSLPPVDSDPSAVASILYSGGTTGTNKGIMLTNYNFNALALQTIAASGLPPLCTLKMLAVMPIFHGFGLGIGIHTALVGGAVCILVPQFSLDNYAKLLVTTRPNIISGVPTLFEALLSSKRLENADLSHLLGVYSGGDTLSVPLKKRMDDFLSAHKSPTQIREGYGTTECVTASCLTPVTMAKSGSIGIPYPDTFYKIVKPGTLEELPANMDGEICISGPTVMLGYLDNEKETADTLCRHLDGRVWLHTGDLGQIDDDGFIYFKQRIKRVIISSGYNVYPSQLENVLECHESVNISCIIGVKDSYKGQKVKGYVVLKDGFAPSEELRANILAHCKKHIAKYAWPYDIEFRAELPKTKVGKIAYRVLEEEANQ
ncbi:MAG: class I adenylate-forming enzyme family protein [Eubacteriales bacterium]